MDSNRAEGDNIDFKHMILCIILLAIWMSLIFQTTIILGHNRFTFISVWLLIYHTRWEWYRIMVMKPSTLEGSGRQIPKHRSAPQATEIRRLGMQGEPILPGLEANMRSAFHIVLWVDTIPHPNLSSSQVPKYHDDIVRKGMTKDIERTNQFTKGNCYLIMSLSLKMQVDSNGGKVNPSICGQETIHHIYAQSSSLYRI